MIAISDRVRKLAKEGGWIAVDWDGTLFTHPLDSWVVWNAFGEPIRPMIDRVKAWLAAGIEVRIFTARVGFPVVYDAAGYMLMVDHRLSKDCRLSGERFSDYMMVTAMQTHLEKHGLPRLKVQCYKDVNMIELWDDRAVQVISNEGIPISGAGIEEFTKIGNKLTRDLYGLSDEKKPN